MICMNFRYWKVVKKKSSERYIGFPDHKSTAAGRPMWAVLRPSVIGPNPAQKQHAEASGDGFPICNARDVRRQKSCCLYFSDGQKSILPPPTITKVWFSSYNYKTGYFTSLNFSNRPFYLPRAVLKTVCYSNRSFVFFFFKKISVESLKNHSKSQKNHKIENPILLDSTWVDIYSEYIIWYTLV